MKWISDNHTQGRLQLASRANLLFISIFALVPTLFFIITGFKGEIDNVMIWAVTAGLSWHCIFTKHQFLIDKNTGVLSRSLTSVYPIFLLQLKLEKIQGFIVVKNHGNHRYLLIAICQDDERVELLGGHQSAMMDVGQHLADFTQKSLVKE